MTPTESTLGLRIVVAALVLAALVVSAVAVPSAAADRMVSEGLVAVALILAGTAIALSGRDRATRESGGARRWLWVLTIATVLMYTAEAVLAGIAGLDADGDRTVVFALPVELAGPFILAAVAALTWPGPIERHERRTVVADTVLGGLGLTVVWLVVVLPAERAGSGGWAGAVQVVATGMEFLGAVAILVLAALARRRNRLAIVQVVLLHLAVLLYIGADVLPDVVSVTDQVLATAITTTGVVLSVGAFAAFALRATDEHETATQLWLRDVWSATLPLSPLPIAAAVLLVHLATGRAPPASGVLVAGILFAVLVGLVWLRLEARRESRRAAVSVATATFSQATDQAWFQALIGNSRDIVLVVDRRGSIVYASPSFCEHVGLDSDDLAGRPVAELVPQLTVAAVRGAQRFPDRPAIPLEVALVDGVGAEHDVQFHVDRLAGLGVEGYVLTGQDVTDARRMRVLLGESRRRDRFTGLLNAEAIAHALEEAQGWSDPRSLAVLVVELSDLRALNDARGRAVGDAILRAAAAALEQAPGPIVAVGRIGFDGFAVLLRDPQPDVAVTAVHDWLVDRLRTVAVAGEGLIRVRLAAGYSGAFSETERASELLQQADLAATRSLSAPHLALVRYEHEMRAALLQQWDQVAALEHALEMGEFVPYYQPIVRLRDGVVVSVEALARRRLPDGGVQLPEEFIPVAERVGLVALVDAAIRAGALADLRALRDHWPGLAVSMNVAPAAFRVGLAEHLVREVEAAGMPLEAVTFEVTESTVAESVDVAHEILSGLRRHGCRVALDDFGTGFSSLDALRTLEVDILKIDQVFVTDLATSPRTLAVMRAITEVGRGLGMITVAEGVRSMEQADLLRGMGCDRVQGFLHAPPMALADLEFWLRERRLSRQVRS